MPIIYGQSKGGFAHRELQPAPEPGAGKACSPIQTGAGIPRAVVVDGQSFPSITAAARHLGISEGALSHSLARGTENYEGHAIAYAGRPRTGSGIKG